MSIMLVELDTVLYDIRKPSPYNLYCVGADVKPCSINQSPVPTDLGG